METPTPHTRLFGWWRVIWSTPTLRRTFNRTLSVTLLIFLLLTVILPAFKGLHFTASNEDVAPDTTSQHVSLRLNQYDSLATMDSLRTMSAYLTTQLELSKRDDITLAINLPDSLVILHIEGVPVREVPLQHMAVSASLKKNHRQGLLDQWLAQPFVLASATASIPKAPVRVVNAPKDTTEANARPPMDIPVETDLAHFTLSFDRDLIVIVNSQPSTFGEGFKQRYFNLKYRTRLATQSVRALFSGQVPDHPHWIRLEMAPEDAKSIFRALPDEAGMALRL